MRHQLLGALNRLIHEDLAVQGTTFGVSAAAATVHATRSRCLCLARRCIGLWLYQGSGAIP